MRVYGLPAWVIEETVRRVGDEQYSGNLRAENVNQHDTNRGPRTTFVIRANNSREWGARLAPSGRRTVAASWEAHRDVIRALFELGATRVKSAVADYRSLEDFEEKYPATRYHQVGSQMFPVTLGELS